MHVSYSLTQNLDFPTLLRLLPALLEVDSVIFEESPPRLLCSCSSEQLERLETQLAHVLLPLNIDWESQSITRLSDTTDETRFFEFGDTALTVLVPNSNMLPNELLTNLMDWEVELAAMRRLSPAHAGDGLAIELYLNSGTANARLYSVLPELARRYDVDLTLAPSDSKRPRRRLIAFDMDSTLIRCEVIDELAKRAGVGEEVAAVTARAMRGELDFNGSFRQRMAKLAGLSSAELRKAADSLPLMPGASALLRTLRAQGHYTVILSGGFDYFAHRVQQRLGIHEVRANSLHIEDGMLTGEVHDDIIDGERKVALLREIAEQQGFDMVDTVAVGDGANDLPMLKAAGLGVAYHAKPLVREQASCAVNYSDLQSLLYVLGVAVA